MDSDDFKENKQARNKNRDARLEKFVNEILDDVIMKSPKIQKYEYYENDHRFVFFSVNGKFTFYPKSGKLLNHKLNRWSNGGLDKILKYIKE